MTKITIPASDVAFECADDDTILRAALREGFGFPYECNVGSCGNCRFEVLEGEVVHVHAAALGDPPAWSERDAAKNRFLGCQARAQGPCTIKVREDANCKPHHKPTKVTGKLVATADVTHDIREFRFQLSEDVPFLPGQYALLGLPGVTGERAYSMCNVADGAARWDFQIRRAPDGKGTAALFDTVAVGDTIALDGPYGMAYLREDAPRDIICMAGGSGLSPMVSIARAMAASSALATRKLHFLYGGRHVVDICGEEFLKDLPGYGTRIFYHAAISDANAGEAATDGVRTGFVHDMAHDLFGDGLADHEIYFAGPPAMGQAIQKLLYMDLKMSPEQVHFDQFY